MSSNPTCFREGASRWPPNELRLRAWSRWFGILFTTVTFASMVKSAEWKFWLVITDPLAWMVLLLAAAAGVVCGYALGCRVQAGRAAA